MSRYWGAAPHPSRLTACHLPRGGRRPPGGRAFIVAQPSLSGVPSTPGPGFAGPPSPSRRGRKTPCAERLPRIRTISETVQSIRKQKIRKCRAFFQRFLFGKLCGNSHSCRVRVAACAQDMVNIVLRDEHRKSGGCLCCTLRFCDELNLFAL